MHFFDEVMLRPAPCASKHSWSNLKPLRVRISYINAMGPTSACVTPDAVTRTHTAQPHVDRIAWCQKASNGGNTPRLPPE
jgi:hypothetical protein